MNLVDKDTRSPNAFHLQLHTSLMRLIWKMVFGT